MRAIDRNQTGEKGIARYAVAIIQSADMSSMRSSGQFVSVRIRLLFLCATRQALWPKISAQFVNTFLAQVGVGSRSRAVLGRIPRCVPISGLSA